MKQIGNYFLRKDDDGVALKENIIQGKKYRFTVLSERLIRLEYNPNGVFEDRISQRVIFRKFPKVKYTLNQVETLFQLTTTYFTLSYDKEKPFSAGKFAPGNNLNIILSGTGSEKMWYYGHPEARNFGGVTYSLDNFSGNLKLGKGLYSTDGFTVLDDSDSLVLDSSGNFVARDDKAIDIYVFMYRKDLGLCLQDYYTLTGYPLMLPRYAFGNWWSKNTKYNNQDIMDLFTRFKEEHIPISGILLGDKWHNNVDPLSFDNEFLKADTLKQGLNHYGSKLGLTVNPGMVVKKDTLSYQSLSGVIKDLNGDYSFLPLNNNNLNLYSTYGFRNWIGIGVDSLYIDYDNIKDKISLSLLSHYAYSMYGLLLNKRAFIMSRNHDFSLHRYGIVYNGKTKVDWNTLEVLPRYQSTASNNGFSYVASPIGGYYGGIENFELYIRYIQLGVFSSILILASDDGKYYKREPWRWNVAESDIIGKYLNLRYKLIPYLYTEGYVYHKSGSPIIQPLYYKYPKIYDEPLYKNQYFFGSSMLVCPITKKKNVVMNRVVQRMFIPEGVWYELESGKKYLGNKYYMSFYKDEDYPVFCREGSIIPLSLDASTELPVNMEILVFPGSDGSYQLYEDDGISNNFLNGSFAITEFNYKYEMNHYVLSIINKGNPGLLPDNRNYKIRFKNTKMANVVVQSGGIQVKANIYNERNDLIIEIENIASSGNLVVECLSDGRLENSMERLINDDIKGILEDLEIETILKEKIDTVLFSELPIRKKRIAVRKLKKDKLEPKFIKMFLNLLEYIQTV